MRIFPRTGGGHRSLTFSTLPPIKDFVISPNRYPGFLPPLPSPPSVACSTRHRYPLLKIDLASLFQNNDGSEGGSSPDGKSTDAYPNFRELTSRYVNAEAAWAWMAATRSSRRRCIAKSGLVCPRPRLLRGLLSPCCWEVGKRGERGDTFWRIAAIFS